MDGVNSKMFTTTAIELLRELKRNGKQLTRYDDTGVRKVVEEMSLLFDRLAAIAQELEGGGDLSREVGGYFCVYHNSVLRNKRCLLAYLNQRSRHLMRLRWHLGRSGLPTEYRQLMSTSESAYFSDYDKVITDYGRTVGLDLSASIEPPNSLYVEVRVLMDRGDVQLESGSVVLHPGMTHFLMRSEVEHLIRQGVLEQVG